jgi:hypothetical protein
VAFSASYVTVFCVIPILSSIHLLISQRRSRKLSYMRQTTAATAQYREIMWNTLVSLIPPSPDPLSLLGFETERMRRAFDCLRSLAYCKLTTGSYGTQGNHPPASVTSSTSACPTWIPWILYPVQGLHSLGRIMALLFCSVDPSNFMWSLTSLEMNYSSTWFICRSYLLHPAETHWCV